jgi:hypothetical protein
MVWIIVIIVIFSVIVGISNRQRYCDVCGLPLKRSYYTWTLEGKNEKLCPNCNARMEKKVSRDAFNEKFA